MCGRYNYAVPWRVLRDILAGVGVPDDDPGSLDPHYNVAPSHAAPVIARDPDLAGRGIRPGMMQWGLVPAWAKDTSIGYKLINARSETAHEKPSFRAAFKRRRCLVLMNGFYEWKKEGSGKRPYHITVADGLPVDLPPASANHEPLGPVFACAGLWEVWNGDNAHHLETFTILTTEANQRLSEVHHRMPVILHPDLWLEWLQPGAVTHSDVSHLLEPYEDEPICFAPLTRTVNSPRNQGPECLERYEPGGDDEPLVQTSLF